MELRRSYKAELKKHAGSIPALPTRMDYENAKIPVVVRPLNKNTEFEKISGKAIFSKTGKTAYVFSDDVTMDTFRLRQKYWICLGVPKQKWLLKIISNRNRRPSLN